MVDRCWLAEWRLEIRHNRLANVWRPLPSGQSLVGFLLPLKWHRSDAEPGRWRSEGNA